MAVRSPSVVGAEECGTAAPCPELGGIIDPYRTEDDLAGTGPIFQSNPRQRKPDDFSEVLLSHRPRRGGSHFPGVNCHWNHRKLFRWSYCKMTRPSHQVVSIAIIGSGLIGPRHAKAVIQDPSCTLHCIVDPSPAAAPVASELGTSYYASISQMLESSSGKPDAAIVCTPNKTHVALSKELLSAGIHVLCEKPISVDIPSGESLVAHARAHPSLHLLAGHHRRFNPYVLATKRILKSETHSIGKITAISGLWALYKPPSYYDPPTEWRRSGESGGPVWINLIHEIDILHYLLDSRIIRVAAFETTKHRGHDAEEGGVIILHFENGVVGTFLLSDAVVSPHAFEMGTGENPAIPRTGRDVYRIFGTDGTLSVPDLRRSFYNTANGADKSWNSEVTEVTETLEDWLSEDERAKVPFELQVAHFVRVVRGAEKPVCSGEDGLAAVRVAEAVRRALRTGGVIEVERAEKPVGGLAHL